ncbi:unnamed protein product [Prunus armeniaca]|uniref:Cyclic nucleotide-binding domain-containing protein n=1 Tax=Prunus armeniaca TaxID=36596 RepID=A0A6J5U8I5_PRUAR|nr:unnamed protein product [Prunus armeniaca]
MSAILRWGCFLAVEIPVKLIEATVKLIFYLIKAAIVITVKLICYLIPAAAKLIKAAIVITVKLIFDPLFLYIPIINHDIKCIDMDKELNMTAFALRAVADFSYFVDLLVRLDISKTIWQSSVIIDILAILPLPQVVIILFFSKAEGWRSLNIAMLMNSLAMVQYVPRILRIYFSCKELKESFNERIGLWIKSVLNFLLYILASHMYMQFDAAREEARKERVNQEMKTEQRLKEKDREIAFWLSENVKIPQNEKDRVKSQIMRTVKRELEELRGGHVEEILSILPSELQSYLNSHMMWKKLKRVPKLDSLDEQVLKAIWKHSKTLKYAAQTDIIKENEPIDKMFFIIEGIVKIESSKDPSAGQLEAEGFFGEELVDWATIAVFPNLLPLSTSSAKATKDVEARVLLASDLCDVVTLFQDHFRKRKCPPPDLVRV